MFFIFVCEIVYSTEIFICLLIFLLSMTSWASLVTQMVKNLPAVQETQVQSLSWEDSLEKGMASHSSILAWRVLWTEEPKSYISWGLEEWNTTEQLTLFLVNFLFFYIFWS